MYVKANPVLSKMFAHCGLTLNEIGLFYYISDNPIYNFLITDNPAEIAEIMGFDYVEFDAAKEYEDFFKLLYTNQYFRPSRFAVDKKNGQVRMFKELAEYLQANPIYKGHTTRQIRDMFEPLKKYDFESRYKRLHELRDNAAVIKHKFNGGVVIKFKPDFDKRNLEATFNKFNSVYFNNYVDRMEFIYSHSEQEIVDLFVKL